MLLRWTFRKCSLSNLSKVILINSKLHFGRSQVAQSRIWDCYIRDICPNILSNTLSDFISDMRVTDHRHFFFYVGFHSRTFTNHKTAGEGGGYFITSSLSLPPASQTLRHWQGDYCRELSSAYPAAGLEPGTFGYRAQVANH